MPVLLFIVENLTHSLVGGLLAQTPLGQKLRYATPTLIIAANLPDADAITALWGGTTALKYHRGITHSLAGIVVEAALLGGLAYIFERRSENRERTGFLQVLLPIFIALLSHPLLDWTNSYGIRPWLPWNGHWYYGDIVFIADPWLWLVLGGGLFLVASKLRVQIAAWVFLAAILALVVLFTSLAGPSNFSPYIKTAWLIGLTCIVLIRLCIKPSSLRLAPVIALITMLVYWGMLSVLHGFAVRNAELSSRVLDGRTRVYSLAVPANPFVWNSIAETHTSVYPVNSFVFKNPDWANATRFPKEASDEMIDKMRLIETGQVFLDFARAYSSKVAREPDGYTVTLRDLRFGLSMYARFNERSEIVSSGLGEKPKS